MSSTPSQLGRYEIQAVLGKGSMGVVYLARDPLIGRLVALKTFHTDLGDDAEDAERFRLRFLREAQSAGILSHPNIVTIHDVVEESAEGVTFIAMEYVQGTNLKEVLRYGKALELGETVDTLRGVAAALDYAHQRGVVHRDVKPANVLLTPERRVKLTDFGIARFDTSNLTHDGQLLGTPNYMSPEQVQGREVDPKTDLFSLGVVFYEMVTRHKPFAADNLTAVTHRIVYDDFTPVEHYVGGMPSGLKPILERALAKDPAKRYDRAMDMVEELERTVTEYERQVALSETRSIEGGAMGSADAPPPPPPEHSLKRGDATMAAAPEAAPGAAPDAAPEAAPDATVAVPPRPPAAETPPRPPTPSSTSAPPQPPAPARRVHWRRVAVAGGLAAVLVLVLGLWLTRSVAPDGADVVIATPEDRLQAEYLRALRQGILANREGDPAAAAAAFRRAASLRPEEERVGRYLALAEGRLDLMRAGEEEALRRAVRLEAGEEALVAGRFQEALSIATAVLDEAPESTAAEDLRRRAAAARAQRERQQAEARRQREERRAEAAAEAAAEEAARAEPVPTEGYLSVVLTVAGEGRLNVQAGDRLLADVGYEHFDRVGLFKRKRPYLGVTRLEEIPLESGTRTIRYRVEPTRGRPVEGELQAEIPPGETRVLNLTVDEETGQLSVLLE